MEPYGALPESDNLYQDTPQPGSLNAAPQATLNPYAESAPDYVGEVARILGMSPDLLRKWVQGSTVGRAVSQAGSAAAQTFDTQVQEGIGNLKAGMWEHPDRPGIAQLGQAAWGGLQAASAPAGAVARGLTELPLTLTEQALGTTRSPAAETARTVGEVALGGALPITLGAKLPGAVSEAVSGPMGEIGAVLNPYRALQKYQNSLAVAARRAPSVSEMRTLYEEGKGLGGDLWYHDFGPTLERIAGPEKEKYAGVIAALSPQSPAGALTETGMARLHPSGGMGPVGLQEASDIHKGSNLYVADRVWEAYVRGGIKEVKRVIGPGRGPNLIEGSEAAFVGPEGIGMSQDKVDNVLKALQGKEIGGQEAMKIQAFKRALLGDRDAVVLDTWMKRIFFPGSPTDSFSRPQYEATQKIIEDYASELTQTTGKKVWPADVQAALWVAKKYADEGAQVAASGSLPFKTSLEHVYRHYGRALDVFGDAGSVAKHLALAGVVIGSGAIGMSGGGGASSDEPPLVTSSGRPMLVQ